jgi:allantoin racemase
VRLPDPVRPHQREELAIWHQSYTVIEHMPRYRSALATHHARSGPADTTLEIHGVAPHEAPSGPNDPVTDQAICEAVVTAEQHGFDVVALGCFYDPALQTARRLVQLPVLGILEQVALETSSRNEPFALVTLSRAEAELAERMLLRYGYAEHCIESFVVDGDVSESAIEAAGAAEERKVLAAFERTCRAAADIGAKLVIPAEGVLAAFLAKRNVSNVDAVAVADPFAVLWRASSDAVKDRRSRQILETKNRGESVDGA